MKHRDRGIEVERKRRPCFIDLVVLVILFSERRIEIEPKLVDPRLIGRPLMYKVQGESLSKRTLGCLRGDRVFKLDGGLGKLYEFGCQIGIHRGYSSQLHHLPVERTAEIGFRLPVGLQVGLGPVFPGVKARENASGPQRHFSCGLPRCFPR